MEPPGRIVTIFDIYRSSGERGSQMNIVYLGFGSGVKDCLRWKSGLYTELHFPDQGLYAELGEALHPEEAFNQSY